MNRKLFSGLLLVCLFALNVFGNSSISIDGIVDARMEFQHSPVGANSVSVVAIHFSLAKDHHFYADTLTAPGGKDLSIIPKADGLIFSTAVMPTSVVYFDKTLNEKVLVYSDKFTFYIPFKTGGDAGDLNFELEIDGLVCSEQMCRPITFKLDSPLKVVNENAGKAAFKIPEISTVAGIKSKTSIGLILPLAIVAGLLLNIMPCVWPVLPIIIMKILEQAKESKAKSIALGMAFAFGIILFFACLAILNIVLKLGFGMAFQWGDQFRNPSFVIAMGLLMIVLAMFMFGVFSFGIPASVAGKGGSGKGFGGAVGTGFLAAVLSTPCSFAILTFVLAWAQTQPLVLATITILLIGVGMSFPYLILTSIPSLLAKMPKPGKWMEMFKLGTGFLLLGIAVKLLEAVPGENDKLISVLYYAVVLATCIWIWGMWVSYTTPAVKKWFIRLIAVAIAIVAGFYFLGEPKADLVDWQKYDGLKIEKAVKNGRPVLIKFTADWCMSCKVVDKTVYHNKKVADLIEAKNVLAIKGDTTERGYPAAIALREVYHEPAVPVTILYLPGKAEPERLHGTFITGKLKKYLAELPQGK